VGESVRYLAVRVNNILQFKLFEYGAPPKKK
jgi:hypothetical protein